jgi:type I restriction enzyme R subunit
LRRTNEAFSRVRIDTQLKNQGWDVLDTSAVRFEVVLPDGSRADYVLCDRHGRALAVVEAKRAAISPGQAQAQARGYASQLKVPYIFLANGGEIAFWDWQREAFPRPVKTFFSQADLERRAATAQVQRDPLAVPIDPRIAGRDYQIDCIDTLCREMAAGRRKLLVEMATGTGKTRTAVALIKRLFEAGRLTRVLFLVDRIPLARQTEDAFAEHVPDIPAYVLRAGRRFQDEKRITITTLQSMVNIYRDYSAGYFDLVISDECHRSIYGKWSGVLKHFDGIQIGLTATPCIASVEDLGDAEDSLFVRDTLRFFEVDKPTFSYRMKDAIRDGTLVPYQIYKAQTVKTAAEGGFEVQRDELDWSAMDAATRAELQEAFGERKPPHHRPRGAGTQVHHSRAQPRHRARIPPGADPWLPGRARRAAQAADRQDHRLRRHQAPRRNPGAALRRRVCRPEARARGALCRLRRLRHRPGRQRGRHGQDQALQERGVSADPGVGQHARHRL